MGYIGSDPVRNDSVSTAQLADDAVTSPKIADDIVFTNITGSKVSASLGEFTSATIEGGTITGITDLAVADGGTGASSLNDLITLTTHTTGNYVGTLTGGTGITSTGATSGEGIAHSISVDASQTQITGLSTVTTGVWNSTFGSTANALISGSFGNQRVGTTDSPTFADLTATGTVTAQEFHTEFVSASIVYTSGSTKFGDTSDDLHSFTGSIAVSGSISGLATSTGSFGRVEASTVAGTFIGNVTGNTSGTALTVTQAAQTAITSVGTLTGLTGGTGDLIWDTPTFVVDSSTNRVGIGTATPSYPVHIYDAGTTQQLVVETTAAGSYSDIAIKSNTHKWSMSTGGSGTDSAYNDKFYIYDHDNSAQRLVIDNSGNVGIGTSTNINPHGYNGSVLTVATESGNDIGSVNIGQANNDSDGSAIGDLIFSNLGTSDDEKRTAIIRGVVDGTTGNERGGKLVFYTKKDGQDAFHATTIDRDGILTVAGDLVVTNDIKISNGRGISFTASSNTGGMSSELLDDYEEGTWTCAGSATNGGTFTLSSSSDTVSYTKIGRQVTVYGELLVGSASASADCIAKFSLPYVAGAYTENADRSVGAVVLRYVNIDSTTMSLAVRVTNGNSHFLVTQTIDDGLEQSINTDQFTAGDEITFTLTYFV